MTADIKWFPAIFRSQKVYFFRNNKLVRCIVEDKHSGICKIGSDMVNISHGFLYSRKDVVRRSQLITESELQDLFDSRMERSYSTKQD